MPTSVGLTTSQAGEDHKWELAFLQQAARNIGYAPKPNRKENTTIKMHRHSVMPPTLAALHAIGIVAILNSTP